MSEHSMNMHSKLRWSDVARLGGTGIRARPTRAILSALGIAIGIAAMVGVIGVSTSSQAQLAEQLRALGTNMLTAQAGNDLSGVSTKLPSDAVGRTRLIDGVEKATSTSTLSGVSVYRSRLVDKNATGGTITMAAEQSLLDVVAGSVAKGTWLNDATAGYPATVLGARAAQLLGVVNPGTQVWIGNTSFTVIGILDPVTLAPELDNAALIGTEIAKQQFDYKGEPTTVYERSAEDKVEDVRALLGPTLSPKNPTSVEVSRPSDALAAKNAAQLGHDRLDKGVVLGNVADFSGRGSRRRRGLAPLLLGATARGRHGLVDRGMEREGRGPCFHAHGDGVGDEDQANPGGIDASRSEGLPCTLDGRDLRARHSGGRIVGADLVQDDVGVGVVGAVLGAEFDRPPLFAQSCRGLGEVFAILTAPRVRGVGGGGQDEDAPGACLGELVEALGHEGVPVAVSPPDGNVMPTPGELRGQVCDQALVAGVNGGDAAEALVVGGDLKQALVGDSATARRVAHKRQDVVRAVRATVGQQHDCVVGIHTWHFSPPSGLAWTV